MRPAGRCITLIGALLMALAAEVAAQPAPDDLKPARDVLAALEKKDYAKARALLAEVKDPLHAKALRWRLAQLKEVSFTFAELAELYRGVKDWPGAARIAERADEAIANAEPEANVLAWFKESPPRGYRGWSAYIGALARSGKEDEAREAAKHAWAAAVMPASDETLFHRRFAKYLAPEDDRLRILKLLRERRTEQALALWSRAILPAEDKAAIALRIVMQTRGALPAEIEAQVAKLPEAIRDEADFRFDRMSWNRRAGRFEAAGKLLEGPPPADAEMRRWRAEGGQVVRELVDAKQHEAAYRAAAHLATAPVGETWATMEFLAGWIALRRLEKHGEALAHFTRLYEKSGAAITRGRGAYWAGRAAAAKGDAAVAEQWYVRAAGFPHVFYGQLAIAALGRDRLLLPADEHIDEVAHRALAEEDMARAAFFFAALDDGDAARQLLLDLAMDAKAARRWAVVAYYAANGVKRREIAVRAARRAGIYGVPLFELGFPTLAVPAESGVEPALALAIIRQESEFYLGAVSSAGARGLMQLMPATARETARRLKMRYDRAKLTEDEAYNLRLGTAFLGQMIERYGGSYPLAAAAYNGGPGNVGKWLARYGDPRSGKVDLVDWIEQIPFEETRNYVQRVLENLAVYRHRAGLKSLAQEPHTLWRPPAGDALKLAPELPPEP